MLTGQKASALSLQIARDKRYFHSCRPLAVAYAEVQAHYERRRYDTCKYAKQRIAWSDRRCQLHARWLERSWTACKADADASHGGSHQVPFCNCIYIPKQCIICKFLVNMDEFRMKLFVIIFSRQEL